jgi:hypothetical protein
VCRPRGTVSAGPEGLGWRRHVNRPWTLASRTAGCRVPVVSRASARHALPQSRGLGEHPAVALKILGPVVPLTDPRAVFKRGREGDAGRLRLLEVRFDVVHVHEYTIDNISVVDQARARLQASAWWRGSGTRY